MGNLDFETLNRALLNRAEQLCFEWLPGGVVKGNEYVCAGLSGGAGRSLSVNLNNGKWSDFSEQGVKGGDLISLYAAIHNIGQGEAYKQLNDQYKSVAITTTSNRKPSVAIEIAAPPVGAPKPSFEHFKFGMPTAVWTYRDKDGAVLNYIARYETPDGKEFFPWSWSVKAGRWVKKQWPKPRPLYNLHLLHKFPTKQVVICEGEKACDAATVLFGERTVCTSWSGGTNNWQYADWSPLKGRNVVIWPDSDIPGVKAAEALANLLHKQCAEVKVVRYPELERKHGKDAADFEGTFQDFKKVVGPLVKKYEPPIAQQLEEIKPKNIQPEGRGPALILSKAGVQTYGHNGRVKCNEANVFKVVKSYDRFAEHFWFDEFHGELRTDWNGVVKIIDEPEIILATMHLQDCCGMPDAKVQTVRSAITAYATSKTRNESREWLESITWDGEDRIDQAFEVYLGVEASEYSYAVSRMFFKSVVARLTRPGCKLDTMVIFEGDQGCGKSKAIRAIAGEDWYTSISLDVANKDTIFKMKGKAIIEIQELAGMNRQGENKLKAFMSTSVDRERKSYGRDVMDFKRTSVLVGTTNEANYFLDATGNRRFFPVRCKGFIKTHDGRMEVDVKGLERDREQLFAEAYHKLINDPDFDYWSVPHELAVVEQDERQDIQDPWYDALENFLEEKMNSPVFTLENKIIFTTSEALLGPCKVEIQHQDHRAKMRVGKILRQLGCHYTVVRLDGKPRRRWVKYLL